MPIIGAFNLSSGDSGFSSRTQSIFDNVDKIKHNLNLNKSDIVPVKRKSNTKSEECPTSTKVPCYSRNKGADDGVSKSPKDAEKWTKYDLSGVSMNDDRENSKAAFSFLHSLSKRNDKKVNEASSKDDEESAGNETKKVVFGKPTGCVKMPEYVVGNSQKPRKPKCTAAMQTDTDKVELDHLYENTESSDYTAEIEARWLAQNKSKSTDSKDTDKMITDEQNSSFKTITKKKRNNVRTRAAIE